MKFLVVTKQNAAFPPEAASMLINAMRQWSGVHLQSGKMEQIWSFAGLGGGGGVLNVDSHEELDQIMAGFPFAQFSQIEVYPLADLNASMDNFEKVIQQMMPPQSH
jgi:muconolactone delta-isomerase